MLTFFYGERLVDGCDDMNLGIVERGTAPHVRLLLRCEHVDAIPPNHPLRPLDSGDTHRSANNVVANRNGHAQRPSFVGYDGHCAIH